MAIKIIEPGINNFKMKCPKCECVFEYSLEDLQPNRPEGMIECPCCGELSYHSWRERPGCEI